MELTEHDQTDLDAQIGASLVAVDKHYSVYLSDNGAIAPPFVLSKWMLLLGVIIVISLYRVSRRRRHTRERSSRGD